MALKLTQKPKTGRRACPDERKLVADFLALYRAAQAAGGALVVNPEDPAEEQATFYANEGALLNLLDHFASEGTFQTTMDLRPLVAAAAAKVAQKFEHKVAAVQEALAVSERTAARLLARPKTAKR